MCKEIPKFVKWAGGKGQLLEQFKPLLPKKINFIQPKYGRYRDQRQNH